MRVPFFRFSVALFQVLRMSVGHLLRSVLSGAPDVLYDLVYLLLKKRLFSGFGRESGMPVSWKTCGALWLLSVYFAFPCPVYCFLSIWQYSHTSIPSFYASQCFLQLALNLREMLAEAVLESVLLTDFNLLVACATVVHPPIEAP